MFLPRNSIAVLTLGLLLAGAGADVAGQGKGKQTPLNPEGEPKGFDAGDMTDYAVWHNASGWHLRTTTGGKKHRFHGRIHVRGGTITQAHSFHLEKQGKLQDHWRLAEKRHELVFDFHTEKDV